MSLAVGQKLTDSQVKKLFRMRESGMTMPQIGRELGITKERVRQILNGQGFKHLGLKIDPARQKPIVYKNKKLHDDVVREMFRLRTDGISPRDIGKRLGVSTGHVREVLAGRIRNSLGLKLKNPKPLKAMAPKFTEEVVRQIFQMRADGMTHAAIADHFGTNIPYIIGIVQGYHRKGVEIDRRLVDRAANQGHRRGSKHYKAKLNERLVRQVFKMRESGKTLSEISEWSGVTVPSIINVLQRKTWRHVQIT